MQSNEILTVVDSVSTEKGIDKDVIFDKSSGKTYFTDQKQYLDRKGDRYQFD